MEPEPMTQLLPMMMYCFVMSITPGPNNLMLTASGANFGYRLTLPQVMGCVMGNVALTLIACNGLGQLFVAFPAAQVALRTGGALYLVWLALKLARARLGDARAPRPLTFLEGVMFQAFNPKSWIRAITLASVFMPAGANPLTAGLAISAIGAVIGFPCISAWALFGVAMRGLLGDPRKQRVFNLAMAVALVVLAVDILR
jgi:threonine/homoserine/homoserine lactone efflux protein